MSNPTPVSDATLPVWTFAAFLWQGGCTQERVHVELAALNQILADPLPQEQLDQIMPAILRASIQLGLSAPAPEFEYRSYLRSPEWRGRRAAALDVSDHRCGVCSSTDRLDVHHRTYDRIGNEDAADLIVLCRSCHTLFHKNGKLAR
jgi:hypothetical protein